MSRLGLGLEVQLRIRMTENFDGEKRPNRKTVLKAEATTNDAGPRK